MLEQISKNGKETLVYTIAKPEEVEEVVDFAEEHYFSLSPIREIFSLDHVTDEERRASRIEGFQKCFQHPTSIVVREKSTGHLVAFHASLMMERSEVSAGTLVDSDNRSFGWLFKALLAELNEGVDLFALYQTDRILQLWRAAVRKDYQGQRLIGMRSTICSAIFAKIAHENNIGAMRVEAASQYAATEKCWQLIRTIPYETFQLPDGKRPFSDGVDLGVHQTIRLLACRPPPLALFHEQSDAMKSLPKGEM